MVGKNPGADLGAELDAASEELGYEDAEELAGFPNWKPTQKELPKLQLSMRQSIPNDRAMLLLKIADDPDPQKKILRLRAFMADLSLEMLKDLVEILSALERGHAEDAPPESKSVTEILAAIPSDRLYDVHDSADNAIVEFLRS